MLSFRFLTMPAAGEALLKVQKIRDNSRDQQWFLNGAQYKELGICIKQVVNFGSLEQQQRLSNLLLEMVSASVGSQFHQAFSNLLTFMQQRIQIISQPAPNALSPTFTSAG